MESGLQLVNDAWFSILAFLPLFTKLLIAQVSKNWRDISRHPALWTKLEISMAGSMHSAYTKDDMINTFFNFVTKYCTSLSDLYFNAGISHDLRPKRNFDPETYFTEVSNQLDELFQIKTLRRVALVDFSLRYHPKKIPLCKDLRILNVTDIKTTDAFGQFIQELPNLEELYLSSTANYSAEFADALAKAQKLRILAIPEEPLRYSKFSLTCPAMEYIVLYPKSQVEEIPNHVVKKITKGTVISGREFGQEIFRPSASDQLKRLAPLLNQHYNSEDGPRSLLTFLATHYDSYQNAIHYLIKERHFDPNVIPTEFFYQPTFLGKIHTSALFPMEGAVISQNLTAVLDLLKLGARAECPLRNQSYLRHCSMNPEIYLTLVEHGADPNKIVQERPIFVEVFKQRTYTSIVDVLINKIDINYETDNFSLLDIAIAACRETAAKLIKAGAKLTARTVGLLLTHNYLFMVSELFVNNKLTAEMFNVESTVTAMSNGFADYMEDILKSNKDKRDDSGMTVLHYMSARYAKTIACSETYKGQTEQSRRWHVIDTTSVDASTKQFSPFVGPTTISSSGPSAAKPFMFDFSVPSVPSVPAKSPIGTKVERNNHVDPFETLAFGLSSNLFGATPTNAFPEAGASTSFDAQIKFVLDDINMQNNAGETPLLLVAKACMIEAEKLSRVDCLLKRGANVNLSDENGWTPLHAACYVGNNALAKKLFDSGANINAQDQCGFTPLMAAVRGLQHNNLAEDLVDELLKNLGYDVKLDFNLTEKHTKRTLLHLLVCVLSDAKAVDTILTNNKHDINARDSDGYTPLHYAVMFGKFELISVLQKHGADFNAQTYGMRLTPAMLLLHITTKASPYFACLENFNLMLQGNRVMTRCTGSEVITKKISVIEAPWNSTGPVVAAQERINLKNVQSALQTLLKEAKMDLTDGNGNTYLHLLLMHSAVNQVNFIEWAEKLPDLRNQWKLKNFNDESPFLLLCKLALNSNLALYSHRVDIKGLVTHFQLDYVTANNRGETPIGYLAMSKSFCTAAPSWLVLPGFDMTIQEQTSLDVWEKLWDNNLLTKQIVNHIIGTNPAMLNKLGAMKKKTLLMLVLERIVDESGTGSTEDTSGTLGSQLECTKVFFDSLLKYKDHLNVQDINGNTALHTACQYFHLGAVDAVRSGVKNFKALTFMKIAFALLDAGADPSIKNNLGLTPIDYAPHVMEFYNQDIQSWLVTAHATRIIRKGPRL